MRLRQNEGNQPMKRFHIHIAVNNLAENIRFYSALFAAEPTVTKTDYAKSDKYWTADPQGIAWEAFHSLATIPFFGEDTALPVKTESACCAPSQRSQCP